MIQFTIPGPPKGKGRPRFARMGNFVKTYTPKETASWENLVKVMYLQANPGPPTELPVSIQIMAYFPIPKSMRKSERELAEKEGLPVQTKPDIDNVLKGILDGLNGVAFVDDKQVYRIWAEKWYSLVPRTEVKITQIK